MGVSDSLDDRNKQSKSARDFLKRVGEDLDRANQILSKLKTNGPNNASDSTLTYDFLQKLDNETRKTEHRHKYLALEKPPSPQPAEPLPTPSRRKPLFDNTPRLCQNCRRLGVRLLKLEENSQPSPAATAPQSPVPANYDDADRPIQEKGNEEIQAHPLHAPAPLPEDLRAVVKKLREMTAVVGELQASLGEAITSQRQHYARPQEPQRQTHKQIKLQKVAELMEELQASLGEAVPPQRRAHLERLESPPPQTDQVQSKKKAKLIRF